MNLKVPKFISTSTTHPRIANDKNTFVFDIDATLYEKSDQIDTKIFTNFRSFLMNNNYSAESAKEEILNFYENFDHPMKGLHQKININLSTFNFYDNPFHGVASLIKKDEELEEMLDRLGGNIICLTDGCKQHAEDVLTNLGVINYFDAVFYCDYLDKNFKCKQDYSVYELVESVFGGDGCKFYFFDDDFDNYSFIKPKGWKSILVDEKKNIKYHLRDEEFWLSKKNND